MTDGETGLKQRTKGGVWCLNVGLILCNYCNFTPKLLQDNMIIHGAEACKVTEPD